MGRGRKQDVTAPLTRSLVFQREYRARKAKQLADLEERCQVQEEENRKLKEEVESLRRKLENCHCGDLDARGQGTEDVAEPSENPRNQPEPLMSKFRIQGCDATTSRTPLTQNTADEELESRWDPSSSSCCDGYFDCRELLEEAGEMRNFSRVSFERGR